MEQRGLQLTAIMCLMGSNDSTCLQTALGILRGRDYLPTNAPTSFSLLRPSVDNAPSAVSPLRHETAPLSGRAARTVECGEADKAAVLVIIDPTDLWETVRRIDAMRDTPSCQTNGSVCRVHVKNTFVCTC